MRSTEVITAEGEGHWGDRHYYLGLMTVVSTWTDEQTRQSRTMTMYELRFRAAFTDQWDTRAFGSNQERDRFMSESFGQLLLKPVSGEQSSAQERPHVLRPRGR
jgi:hypothetical protein